MILKALFERIPAVLCQGSWDTDIASIAMCSKEVTNNSLFICIKGMEQDGHQYIQEAAERGAAACLVEEAFWKKSASVHGNLKQAEKKTSAYGELKLPEQMTIVSVQNTREAAAWAAAAFYRYPSKKLKVIGITGTKGKTSTTFMIRDILEAAGYKTGLLGTIDYEIGEEKKRAERTCRFAVMEVSSQGLKLHRSDGILFDVGVFTNLGRDHIGPKEHKDMAEYAHYKSLLFQKCCFGIGNIDDPYYREIFKDASCQVCTYSCRQKADVQASDIMLVNRNGQLGTFFKVNGEEYAVSAPGEFSVYNAVAAITVCRHYGIDQEIIRKALKTIRVPGRMEVIDNDRGYLLLIDYAHNAMSMKNILETMRRYHPRQLWVLFGCGGGRSAARRREMGCVAGKYADFTVITSDNPRYEEPERIMQTIEEGMKETKGQYQMMVDRKEAMRFMLAQGRPGDILILAGKGHEQYQEIKGDYLPFNEREIAQEILADLD